MFSHIRTGPYYMHTYYRGYHYISMLDYFGNVNSAHTIICFLLEVNFSKSLSI
jgi:hypothetical protein